LQPEEGPICPDSSEANAVALADAVVDSIVSDAAAAAEEPAAADEPRKPITAVNYRVEYMRFLRRMRNKRTCREALAEKFNSVEGRSPVCATTSGQKQVWVCM
jgi:hypothetical protein